MSHSSNCSVYWNGICDCDLYRKELEMSYFKKSKSFDKLGYEPYYGVSYSSGPPKGIYDVLRTHIENYRCIECGMSMDPSLKDSHIREHARQKEEDIKKSLEILNNPEKFTPTQITEAVRKLVLTGNWEIRISPALAHGDRKGFQVFIIEPKK